MLANYDCMTIAEAPLVTPQRALDYIAESDTNEIDMMIQFQCMCADCFFTDYMPRKFSLNRLRRAFSSWQTELDGRGWNALYLETTTIRASSRATAANSTAWRAARCWRSAICF